MVVFKPAPSVSVVIQSPESSEDVEVQPPVTSKSQRIWRKGAVLGLLRNFLPGPSTAPNNFQRQLSDIDTSRQQRVEQSPGENSKYDLALDESSKWLSAWNTLISLACIYNLIAIPLLAFDDIFNYYYWIWLAANLVADFIYGLDLIFKNFVSYYSMGLLVRDVRRIFRKNCRKKIFILDVIAFLPTDLLLIKWNGLFILRSESN
ncbi:Ion-trans domain-containing protein [Aphelenchoides bicaudatus]|nr:Ion-trans domain-containing protein [Aphelenchoides bicaudatus]